MHINISNNKQQFVVSEVYDRCVVTSAAATTWWNVHVVDVQLLVIGHRNQNTLLLQMRIGRLRKSGRIIDEGDCVFDYQAAAFVLVVVKTHFCPSWHFQRLCLVGQLFFNSDVDIVIVQESQQFTYFSADSVRLQLHQL